MSRIWTPIRIPPSSSDFVNFAATCKRFASEAFALYMRRRFVLAVSNYGISFEGHRDASPMQTFSVLPHDQGSLTPRWAMIDSTRMRIAKIPPTDIPDNLAFGAFSKVFKRLRSLHLHVDIDVFLCANGKTKFFLGQIGRFLLSQARTDSLLSELHVNVNFVNDQRDDDSHPKTCSLVEMLTVLDVVRESRGKDFPHAQGALFEISSVLATLTPYLLKLHTKQEENRLNHHGETGPDSLLVKMMIRGNEARGLAWNQDRLWKAPRDRYGTFTTWNLGSFEDFCNDLQRRLYGTGRGTVTVVDSDCFICELEVPTGLRAPRQVGSDNRKRKQNPSNNEPGVFTRSQQRRRLG
jgi:hypothetical protein